LTHDAKEERTGGGIELLQSQLCLFAGEPIVGTEAFEKGLEIGRGLSDGRSGEGVCRSQERKE